MKRLMWCGWLAALVMASVGESCAQAPDVTLTGVIQGANGLPAANTAINFTPSQTFYLPGTNTTQQIANIYGNGVPTGACAVSGQLYSNNSTSPPTVYQCIYSVWTLVGNGSGGATPPAGSSFSAQYNNSGAFGGAALNGVAIYSTSAAPRVSTTSDTVPLSVSGQAATVGTINGLVAQGSNITVTGSGTIASPYVITGTGGGLPAGCAYATQYNNSGAFGGACITGLGVFSSAAVPRAAVQADVNPFYLSPGPFGTVAPNALGATVTTFQFNSGTSTASGNGSISAALGRATASGTICVTNCTSLVDPAYLGTEDVPALPYSEMHVTDSRYGFTSDIYRDWPSIGQYAQPVGAHMSPCLDYAIPDFQTATAGVNTLSTRYCHYSNITSSTPGINQIFSTIGGATGFSVVSSEYGDQTSFGQGLKGSINFGEVSRGAGDNVNALYMDTIPAWIAPTDQGVNGLFINPSENTKTFTGTIASASSSNPGSTWMRITPTGGTNLLQGVGRYLLGETALASGSTVFATSVTNGSGYAPAVVTLGNALPSTAVSTAWGVSTSACLPNITVANTGSSCTVTINVTSGTFTSGTLGAATGTNHNQFAITAASTTGGVATITFNADHQIPVGAWYFDGNAIGSTNLSCTGTGMVFTANTTGSPALKYPIDVVGCTDTTHVDAAWYSPSSASGTVGTIFLGNVTFASSQVYLPLSSTSGGVVSIYPGEDVSQFIGGTVNITGSAYSPYNNVPCTGFAYNGSSSAATCTIAGVGAHTDSTASGVSVTLCDSSTVCKGYGNTNLALYPIAEDLDVRDPAIPSCVWNQPFCNVNGYAVLEANEIPSTPGYSLEESHHYSQNYVGNAIFVPTQDPYESIVGLAIQAQNMFGNGNNNSSGNTMLNLGNSTPVNLYSGLGGTQPMPNAISVNGAYRSWMSGQYAPANSINGLGGVLEIPCPALPNGGTDCTNAAYRYNIFRAYGVGGSLLATITPSTTTMDLGIFNGVDFQITPTLFSMNRDLYMNSHGIHGVNPPSISGDVCVLGSACGAGGVNAGTANQVAIYATTGSQVSGDALLTDNGTTLTYGGTGGMSVAGAAGAGGSAAFPEGTAASSASATDVIYADSTAHCLKVSNNGGSFACLPPNSMQSYYANIAPALYAVTTMLGPVYYIPNPGITLKLLIGRMSGSISCSVQPIAQFVDLGTSATTAYGSGTLIGSVSLGTSDGVSTTTSTTALTAGHYYGFGFSQGTCATSPTFDLTAQVQ